MASKQTSVETAVLVSDEQLDIVALTVTGSPARAAALAAEQGHTPEEAVRRMLEVGAAVLLHGSSSATVDAVSAQVDRVLNALSERADRAEQVRRVASKVAAKGLTFEDDLFALIDACFAPHADVAEHTGATRGIAESLVGDFVITLNPSDTAGADRRVVIEAKDKALSMNKTLDELDAAMKNRSAQAGVLVFASAEQAPLAGKPLRVLPGNRIVCVCDPADGDPLALEVACQLARSLAMAADAGDGVDRAVVADALARLCGVIEGAGAVKRGLSSARRGLDSAETAYLQMRDDALGIVTELRERL